MNKASRPARFGLCHKHILYFVFCAPNLQQAARPRDEVLRARCDGRHPRRPVRDRRLCEHVELARQVAEREGQLAVGGRSVAESEVAALDICISRIIEKYKIPSMLVTQVKPATSC